MFRATFVALGAAASVVTLAPCVTAQTQTSQLVVYLDRDAARQLVMAQLPPSADTTAADRARLATLQADYKAKTDLIARNQSVWSATQLNTATLEAQAIETSIRSVSAKIQFAMDWVQSDMRAAADLKIDRALLDYRTRNPVGIIVTHGSGLNEDAILVPGGSFEISDSIAEMVKSGPGAFAQAHPGRLPVVKFVDAWQFYELTGARLAVVAENERLLPLLQQKSDTFAATSSRLRQLLANNNAKPEDLLQHEREKAELGVAQQENEKALLAFQKRHYALARSAAALWLAQNPNVVGADVVRFIGADDGITISNPKLDVTQTVAAAVKGKF